MHVVWSKIDHDRALPYARRCLVNHKIDVWRATRHEVADVAGAGEVGSASVRSGSQAQDGAMAATDHRDDLVRRLSRLPEQQRKIVARAC
jgi:DNA-directed RNA polymerase specialized sigma24 family protein